jgi:hypothetical protein
MKRTNRLWIILDLIFLVVFNAVFFVAGGFAHKPSVWISYGFIHFAYLMLLITPALTRKGKSASVFGFSLCSVSTAYFLAGLAIGAVFILINPDSYKTPLLVQLCVAALYGIALISNMIATENTADAEENRAHQIDYVKKASVELKGILDNISDKEAKKKVEKLYDTLYSSPVKSHRGLTQTESQILESIDELGSAVSSGNKDRIIALADSLLAAVNERNRQLKTIN